MIFHYENHKNVNDTKGIFWIALLIKLPATNELVHQCISYS